MQNSEGLALTDHGRTLGFAVLNSWRGRSPDRGRRLRIGASVLGAAPSNRPGKHGRPARFPLAPTDDEFDGRTRRIDHVHSAGFILEDVGRVPGHDHVKLVPFRAAALEQFGHLVGEPRDLRPVFESDTHSPASSWPCGLFRLFARSDVVKYGKAAHDATVRRAERTRVEADEGAVTEGRVLHEESTPLESSPRSARTRGTCSLGTGVKS